jgi:hypothetical protein
MLITPATELASRTTLVKGPQGTESRECVSPTDRPDSFRALRRVYELNTRDAVVCTQDILERIG